MEMKILEVRIWRDEEYQCYAKMQLSACRSGIGEGDYPRMPD
jgi:hypothetical protein